MKFKKRNTKILIVAYILLLVAIYLVPYFLSPSRRNWYSFHQSFFNFIPFKTNFFYLSTIGTINLSVTLSNLLSPLLLFLPLGAGLHLLNPTKKFIPISLVFISFVSVFFLVRAFAQIGPFDIDKIFLFYLGFSIGYFLATLITKRKASVLPCTDPVI